VAVQYVAKGPICGLTQRSKFDHLIDAGEGQGRLDEAERLGSLFNR
jgi:hypothetical protein